MCIISGHDLKSFLQEKTTSLAQMACSFQKMFQLVEAEQAKSLKQKEMIIEKDRYIKELEDELSVMKNKEEEHAEKMSRMESKLEEAGSIFDKNNGLESKLVSLEDIIDGLEATAEENAFTIDQLKLKETDLNGENSELKKMVSDLEDVLQEVRKSKDDANVSLTLLSEQLDKLKDENATYKAARQLFVESTDNSGNSFTPRALTSSNTGSSKTKKRKTTPTTTF